jgi:hypothetical protein
MAEHEKRIDQRLKNISEVTSKYPEMKEMRGVN